MNSAQHSSAIRKPFIDHIKELQVRLMWCVFAVTVGSFIGFSLREFIIDIIHMPLGQTLYYSSPTGGLTFIFKLCIAFGIVLALPVIIYHSLKFFAPLLNKRTKALILYFSLWSIIMACLGLAFAYWISLPAALRFLAQFGGENIQSLISTDEYFNFALIYLAGFAILFQLPLIILFISKITPLKPKKMLKGLRYTILFSFIGAAILTPTPDPINQTFMAVPAIILYMFGILLVAISGVRNSDKSKSELIFQNNLHSTSEKPARSDNKPHDSMKPTPNHSFNTPPVSSGANDSSNVHQDYRHLRYVNIHKPRDYTNRRLISDITGPSSLHPKNNKH